MAKETHRRRRSRVEAYAKEDTVQSRHPNGASHCPAQSPRSSKNAASHGTNGNGKPGSSKNEQTNPDAAEKTTNGSGIRPQARPKFSDLPLHPSHPPGSAWGLYGDDDELGTLNLLTPAVVSAAAASEIRLGETVTLNLPLTEPLLPMNPRRKPCTHTILAKGYANDDELHMNTQGSSHWDGLRHYPYQAREEDDEKEEHEQEPRVRFYNGVRQADISGPDKNTRLGIQAPAQRGIAGRGVLLDWRAWADAQGMPHHPFATHAIPVDQLEAVAAAQGLTFRTGDILLVRTGWTEAYRKLATAAAQRELAQRPVRAFVGVESSRAMLAWHWDHGFAAVAGDTNAYEAWPPTPRDYHHRSCHEVFLSGWGMPIGELWDLEALARRCRELGRWSFFLTSCPLNLPAGVASPPNAMALF